MLFNSFSFLVFFFVVTLIYFLIPQRYKWWVLLAASIYFYLCFNPLHILILLFITVISFFSGLLIHRFNGDNKKIKVCLTAAGVVISFLFLIVGKYADFLMQTVYGILDSVNISYTAYNINFWLPVGISFFSFKAVSYIIDVYRNKIIEKNFFKYLLYISFFPQIASGPIERSTNLIPQFDEKHKFNPVMIEKGMSLMLIGLFKKMVVADNLSTVVSNVFNKPELYSPMVLFAMACIYSVQIFCDFSGYSDIAIGCIKVLGFETEQNFNHPYFAKSIADFWRKWHISLSSWFRDYLYIPLGGNRKGILRKYVNIMIIFITSGLWHGAAWNFIFWGFLHGLYQIIGSISQKFRNNACKLIGLDKHKKTHKLIQILVTFILVTFAWIFFRVDSIGDGFNYIKCMFSNPLDAFNIGVIIAQVKTVFNSKTTMISFFVAIVSFVVCNFFDYKKDLCEFMQKRHTLLKIIYYSLFITFIMMFASTSVTDFIYIRF